MSTPTTPDEVVLVQTPTQLQQTAVEARARTIIMPRYVVPPKCAAHCRHLRKAADEAILRAVTQPDTQMVVICSRHRKIGCNAYVMSEGSWDYAWGGSNELVFRESITYYENGGTVDSQIARAIAAGAHEYNELPVL